MDIKKCTGWNYRVFLKKQPAVEGLDSDISIFEIGEAYYDENGSPSALADRAEPFSESLAGLKWTLEKMLEACEKPIIDYNTGEEIIP